MAGSKTRQLLPREERQESILRAAATAFARGGFAATSMDDVAGEAGVTRLIVYRHFATKEELYRSVLDRVHGRLQEKFLSAVGQTDPELFSIRPLLSVAREDPDGFRLLVLHAAREPQFEDYVAEVRGQAIANADLMIGAAISDQVLRPWVTRTIVGYLYETVLAWLEVGDPAQDDTFAAEATRGLVAMFTSWTN